MSQYRTSGLGLIWLVRYRVYQVAKGLMVVGLRLLDSVFGLFLLTTEPRTSGVAAGGDDYIVFGIENLDC
jgi:hypothetical protein